MIELKIHAEDSALPFYVQLKKGERNFESLALYAELVVSRLEDADQTQKNKI